MLGFIQRYQKILFAVIAALICVSFLFFGLLPKGAPTMPDKVAYKTAFKDKIKQSKFDGVKAMILTNNGEYTLFGQALGHHYFSENFLVSDLMKPGLLSLVLQKNMDDLKADLTDQYKKEVAFQPYVHPNASFLSAQTIWSIHAPKLEESIQNYKKIKGPLSRFEEKQKLFLEESKFPSFALWQMLSENESQFDWVPTDPNLNPQRLNLFGYHSLEDWFGDKLIKKTCEFIFEVNALAKQKGYRITDQEAEQDLMKLNELNFMKIKALGVEDFTDSQAYFDTKLRHLGFNKVQMISLWKELLIFRRFFQESGNAALLDSFALKNFEQHASQKVKVNQYSLPKPLQCKTLQDLMELEVYLEALGKPLNQLSLEFKMKELDKVAAETPQLVEQPVLIQYKEVDLSTVALAVKVQDIWKWKLDPQNYKTLIQKFPKLGLSGSPGSEAFQESLENLDALTNLQIDQYVREVLLKENTDWLDKAFSSTEAKQSEVLVSRNGKGLPFKNLELSSKKEAFLKEFFSANEKKEYASFSQPFTFDDQHYYQVLVTSNQGPEKLVDFEKLKGEYVLQKLLYKRLNQYSDKELKAGKNLSSVQKKWANQLFEPLKKEIIKEYLVVHKEDSRDFSDQFYCQYRFHDSMRKALDFLKENSKVNEQYTFNNLWTLEASPHTYVRYLSSEPVMESLLSLKEGQWTPVNAFNNRLEFSHVLQLNKPDSSHVMQKKMKKKINQELKRAMAREILDQI